MNENPSKRQRSWVEKFGNAFRGVATGVCGQSSFYVHAVVAVLVIVAAAVLRTSRLEWALLVICIFTVLVAEMFNSALEYLSRAVDQRQNNNLGQALDIGSAAVLLAAIGSSLVGALILLFRLGVMLRWWQT